MAVFTWKNGLRAGAVGLTVWGVSYFAGPTQTISFTNNAAGGTGWGLGVAAGAAPEVAVGFSEGFDQSRTVGGQFGSGGQLPAPTPANP